MALEYVTHLMAIHLAIIVLLSRLVDARQCWSHANGRSKIFFCSVDEQCCGGTCCRVEDVVYTLWYFWLTVVLLLFLCAAGIYWMRRRYIYHKLLAVPAWNSQQLSQTRLLTGTISIPSKPVEIPTEPFPLPPYTPPVNPPPYTERLPDKPPMYKLVGDGGEKTSQLEQP